MVGLALALGPPLASAILAVTGWRWLYWQFIPVGIFAIWLALRWLPEAVPSPRRFDLISAALCAATFACLLFAIAGAAHLGRAPLAVALSGCTVCGALLLRRDRGRPAPILAADLFRMPVFALSSLTSILSFSVQGLVFVVLPFLFQFRLGFTQVEAGLLILPWPITLIVMTFVAARSAERIHPGILGGLGLALLALGLIAIATMSPDLHSIDIAWRLVLCGIGFGLFQSPNMIALMSSAPPSRSGSAGGILATSRLLGQSIGAAVVAFCMSRWSDAGLDVALWTGAALALLACVVSLTRLAPLRSAGR